MRMYIDMQLGRMLYESLGEPSVEQICVLRHTYRTCSVQRRLHSPLTCRELKVVRRGDEREESTRRQRSQRKYIPAQWHLVTKADKRKNRQSATEYI